MTNSLKLRSVILEKGFTQDQIAEKLGISSTSLNYKINNKTEFKASEIKKLSEILELTQDQVNDIFFAEDVDL